MSACCEWLAQPGSGAFLPRAATPSWRRCVAHNPVTSSSQAGPIESSLVLAADDPKQLAGFYGLLLDSTAQPGLSARHWRLPLPSGGRLEIYAPSSRRPRPRQHGRLGICATRAAGAQPALQVLHDWRLQLLARGAAELEPARLEPFGAEAWMADPEGNPFLLLVQGGTS